MTDIVPTERIVDKIYVIRNKRVILDRDLAELYGLPGEHRHTRGDRLLEMVGLSGRITSKAAELSGGMKRLLNLALSIVHDPAVLILDEPFTELDPYNRMRIRSLIRTLRDDHGKTVIITSNDTNEIDAIADRIAIIEEGRLLTVGTPKELKEQYTIPGASLEEAFTSLVNQWRRR